MHASGLAHSSSHTTHESRSTFAEVTALEPLFGPTFGATLDAEWSIGGRPNGGYLLAILGRAATSVVRHNHAIAASAHFLHSPAPGRVHVVADVLREGRSMSRVRTRLSQDGVDCVEALVTVGGLDEGGIPYWSEGLPELGSASIDDAIRLKGPTPDGTTVALLEQVDLRLDPVSTGFMTGRPGGRGQLSGWLSLPGGEPFDPLSLLFAIDSFPPGTLDIEASGWVPTLDLSVYVRALPAPGPVRIVQQAGLIDGQRVDEACFVWDSTGRLVAQGTQLAGIRLG